VVEEVVHWVIMPPKIPLGNIRHTIEAVHTIKTR